MSTLVGSVASPSWAALRTDEWRKALAAMVFEGMQSQRWAAPPTISFSISDPSALRCRRGGSLGPSRAAADDDQMSPGIAHVIPSSSCRTVDTEHGPQTIGNLTDGGPVSQRNLHRGEEVSVPFSLVLQVAES